MTYTLSLRALDTAAQAPFDFVEFERRSAQLRHRTRQASLSAVAAATVLAIVPVVALVTQAEPAAMVLDPPPLHRISTSEMFRQTPALVDMNRFAVTSELEDHIALLDAEISAARLRPVAADELRRMERARRQLNDSLQRVNYAHSLLDL